MIVIDTSALVSILMNEPEAEQFALAIQEDDGPVISAASYVELILVMKYKKGKKTKQIIEKLITSAGITIESVTANQSQIASESAYKYSVLNYGDTFSYALAKENDAPLLFKGNDFSQTDVKIAKF